MSILLGFIAACTERNLSILGVVVLGIVYSIFFAIILHGVIGGIQEYKRRKELGIDLDAKLEDDPEKVKEHMLFIMQFGHREGIVGMFNEFNTIFRNYPQWELQNWDVFRSWYKAQIDHMVARPNIYGMTIKEDGSPYSKEKDPLYDPDAFDWYQFKESHFHNYDDDDDNYYDDDD
ncbi:MAG: hypothetical protein K2M98_01690 [Muribaculum sp.]|nr:hypothetical protein [Muribaculum sp.]